MEDYPTRYAITFGEAALAHVGGQKLGSPRSSGFSVEELRVLQDIYGEKCDTELVMLSDVLPDKEDQFLNEAAVLVLRAGVSCLWGLDDRRMYLEQKNIDYDTKYWCPRRRKTLNKQSRWNIMFGDEKREHNEDYSLPTVCAFQDLPLLARFRAGLQGVLGSRAAGLNAEGNFYHKEKAKIGFHGDTERKIVICLSLGKTATLRFHWRLPGSSEHTLPPVDIEVRSGDVYIMSERAVGNNWLKRSQVRVVHAAAYGVNHLDD